MYYTSYQSFLFVNISVHVSSNTKVCRARFLRHLYDFLQSTLARLSFCSGELIFHIL